MPTLLEILNKRGIDEVILVDDSYDAPRNEEEYDQITEFWEAIEKDSASLAELKSLGHDVKSREDVNNDALRQLWLSRDNLKVIKTAFHQHVEPIWFNRQEGNLSAFIKFLSDSGIKHSCLGSKDEFKANEHKLVFIDYYLAPLGTQTDQTAKDTAIKESIRVIRKIIDDCDKTADKSKPLIIVMSSFPEDVTATAQAWLRDQTGLLTGMFYFLSKNDMPDRVFLDLKLEAIASSLPLRYEIQHFVDSIQEAIKDVAVGFIKNIKELSIEDYAYIHKLSLREDGHPLGDYLLWLYSAYFGHLLFEKSPKVNAEQKKLNGLKFEELPLNQISNSHIMNEIYASALFTEVEDIGAHPLSTESEDNIYLHLGDIFIGDSNKIFMALSAQCDLAFAPLNPKREFKKKQDYAILFVPGTLLKINEEVSGDEIITDILLHDNKIFKIKWDIKEVITKKYGDVANWLKELAYKRRYRLRLPYALVVQHAYVSNLSRVGLPVSPPLPQRAIVTVYRRDLENNGKPVLLLTVENEVSIIYAGKQRHLRLTENFVFGVRNAIKLLSSELKEKAGSLAEPLKSKTIKYSGRLLQISDDTAALKELWEAELPEKKKTPTLKSSIRLMRNGTINDQTDIGESICINISMEDYGE